MDFRLLGTFEVRSGGRVLDIGSPKQRIVLAMLVLHLNRVVPLDVLVEELWGEDPPASATPTVQSLVSRLRRALSEAADGVETVFLRSRDPGYVLEADPGVVDAHRFECLVAGGREALAGGDPEAAVAALAEALGLWRGAALTGLADRSFATLEAARLDETRLAAIEELAEAELALARPGEALARLRSHVADHPLRERAWGQLMLSLYRLGRQAEALRAYQQVRRLLVEELGVEPTPWLRGLEEQILHQRPELDSPLAPHVAGVSPPSPDPVARRGPGDTIVFLFTDIEASTRRWEGQQEAMAHDLARHDELLRAAVESAQGHVFSHTGDGLCAAFPTATSALAAAVAGQQALLAQDWDQMNPLRVRMAVHAGTAERHGETYIGPTLNRVARLLSIAAGGQVVCSQAAVDLARDHVPPGITLLDLGEHALADLARPEHVFQVAHPQLPSAFPPLRSPGFRRDNLPLALSAFIGRASELEELVDLLASARLVTLTGVGGAGKTRLALEAAGMAAVHFPDGVWVVELGPLRDPSGLVSEVMAAVGLEGGLLGSSGTSEEHLCEQLQGRRLLLVLDNCEHLIEAVARLVHAVLSHCPSITVVATSREVLGLPGEVVWGVPPLSLPPPHPAGPEDLAGSDAVALFCERASRAGFGLSSANAAAVGQICRRLDGIPLALELAAARIPVLGAHQLAARLDDRFRLLTGGARTAVPRHQTLRAAMDWSYQLLPPLEQVALRRLSVFPDSFDLEAAEAVVGAPAGDGGPAEPGFEVLDLLARLVEKSLVSVQSEAGDVRYRLLETVRQYAGEKLAGAGETAATHRRHRDFFLGVMEGRRGDDYWGTEGWNRLFSRDYASFRAAVEWSLDEGDQDAAFRLTPALYFCGLWGGRRDATELLERALAGPALPATRDRAEALIELAVLLTVSGGDLTRCTGMLEEGLELGRRLNDWFTTMSGRYFLGEVAMGRGDVAAAKEWTEAVLDDCDATTPTLAAWCHYNLGWLALAEGDEFLARTHFDRGLGTGSGRDAAVIPHLLAALAAVTAAAGEADRARSLSEEAVSAARTFSLRGILVMALTRATEAAILSGDGPGAEIWMGELLVLLRELGARRWVADALETAALVHHGRGRDAAAACLLGAAGALRDAFGEPAGGRRILSEKVRTCRDRVAEALGADGFAEEEARGRKMSVEEALSYALVGG